MAGLQFPYAVVLFYFRGDLRDLHREGEVRGCAGLCREKGETPPGTLPLLGYRGRHTCYGVAAFHGRWGWEVHLKRHPPRPQQPPPVVSSEPILYVPRDGRGTEDYKKRKSMVVCTHHCCCFALLYNRAPGIFNIGSTMRCWVYFVAGVVLEENGILERETTPQKAAVPVIIGGIVLLVLWAILGSFNDPLQRLVVGGLGIAVCFLAASLTGSLPDGQLYRILHRDSFGIYLAHPMIIYVLMDLVWKYGRDISALAIVPAVFVVTLGGATVVTEVIRKIRLGAVIGE